MQRLVLRFLYAVCLVCMLGSGAAAEEDPAEHSFIRSLSVIPERSDTAPGNHKKEASFHPAHHICIHHKNIPV